MPEANTNTTGWGLIAGNGRFPFLVLEGARSQGIEMAVIALKEEASPELEKIAKRLHWVSLGELSKTIDLMHQESVTQAVMAGQVKHNKLFSSIRPDWKLAKLLFSLPRKNTDALIGAVARVLEEEATDPGTRCAHAARAERARSGRHRVWSRSGQAHRRNGRGANRGDSGARVRGGGSDGRHR